ncbi:MAG: type II toxin-antitoxin system HipA family toxin [Alphaproteobacteria bacterium]|nr:MAG: type II toxin-antitoxin system HipA family toxin [Alphaproteobacteria bacterium]
MADVAILDVQLYGESIGTLTRFPDDRILFAFRKSYIDNADRPILSLSFKDEFGGLIADFPPTQTAALPFFSNLLPEGQMRKYLAERAKVKPIREFFLLWMLGQDMPGAVVIRPADGESAPPAINEEDEETADDQDQEGMLRFSLAGVQLKFSAVNKDRKGLTIPAGGIGGSWIVKLPSREYKDVPENEFSMMTLAKLVGINVPEIKLVPTNKISNLPEGFTSKGQAFVIKRFDRLEGGEALHIEDFAQVFRVYPDAKYKRGNMARIAEVINAESRGQDIEEFIRRLTFNTLIGNADMHLKNWSIIYPSPTQPRLAPAYDFVSTIPYLPTDEAALKVSRSKLFSEFTDDELKHFSANARLSEKIVLDAAYDTVERFHQHWKQQKKDLPISQEIVQIIEKHLKTVPIANK